MAKGFSDYVMNALNDYAGEKHAAEWRDRAERNRERISAEMHEQEKAARNQDNGEVFAQFASGLFKQPKHIIDNREQKQQAHVKSAPSRRYTRLL